MQKLYIWLSPSYFPHVYSPLYITLSTAITNLSNAYSAEHLNYYINFVFESTSLSEILLQ